MNEYLVPAFEELFADGINPMFLSHTWALLLFTMSFLCIDGLAVMAMGLGIKSLYNKFIKAYCRPHQPPQHPSATESDGTESVARLVFCLNSGGQEGDIRSFLLAEGVPYSSLPIVINNKVTQASRSALYAQGGCFFITARVMIVDLLTERVDPSQICGFLVFKGDTVGEMSMEAFILKLFKQVNPHGFVKV